MVLNERHNLRLQSLSMSGHLDSSIGQFLFLQLTLHNSWNSVRSWVSNNRFGEIRLEATTTINFFDHLQARLHYENSYAVHDGNSSPRLSSLNTSLSYRHKKFQVALKCNNLFNATTFYSSSSTATADLLNAYNYLRPRQIILLYTYKF